MTGPPAGLGGDHRRSDTAASAILALATADDATLDQAILQALEIVARFEHADRAYITDFRPDGTFETSHEWTAPGIESHRPAIREVPQAGFTWSVNEARAGRPIAVEELSQLPPEAGALAESFGAFGVRSLLEVPIFLDDQLRWVIGLNRIRTSAPWQDESIELSRRIGQVIGRGLARRAVVDELRVARDRAERAARTAEAFLSQMGHELRTPLHAILGFAELIDASTEPPGPAIVQITENGRHLLALVEDLLELARFTADGDTALAPKRTVGATVRDVLTESIPQSDAPSIEIGVDDDLDGLILDVEATHIEGVIRCMIRSIVRPGTRSLHVGMLSDVGQVGLAITSDRADWVPDLHRGFPISRALLVGLNGRLEIRHTIERAPIAIAWVPSATAASAVDDMATDQPARP
jgi:signal transduction histidine kinase